jgi:polysaccharide biosynthesis transport protein
VLAFGGFFAGLAWAFLIELFLDRSVKRPSEVESKLKLPLLLSIPNVNRNGNAALEQGAERKQLPLNASEGKGTHFANGDSSQERNGALQVVSLEQNLSLLPFFEALRDRLIADFEIKGLTHKPKLVAVTGTASGAGVSTIAVGLAASLSATGEGNVLLVDMNIENGAAQQFYKGKVVCGLDTALKTESRQDALMQDNLYVVNGNSNNNELPNALPKRFSALVPKLKASEYDYIIFDMPVVSPTSITSRLASFMDITLLVVESEKNDRDVIIHANQWLTVGGASVSVVLNKTRQYVPGRLHREFLNHK